MDTTRCDPATRTDCVSVSLGFVQSRLEDEELIIRLQKKLNLCQSGMRPASFTAPPDPPRFVVPVGYPPCQGGERGFWQPYLQNQTVYLAVTVVDFLDPSTVRCWVQPQQSIATEPLYP